MLKTVLTIVLLASPLAVQAETAAEIFQAGLALEKGEGDLAGAIKRYHTIIERYPRDRIRADLLVRTGQRMDLLSQRLGLENPYALSVRPRPFGALARGLDLTARRVRSLGMTTRNAARTISDSTQRAGRDATLHPLTRHILALRARLGLHGLLEYYLDPSAVLDSARAVGPAEQQIRAFRIALGITGLLEYVDEVRRHHRFPRPATPAELYLAGLFAEREEGDLKKAVGLFEKAVAAETDDRFFDHRVRLRLERCRESLERRGNEP